MTEFSVLAPAKINLFLEVLDTREDGYHNVSLVNQTVDFVDRLTFTESAEAPDDMTVVCHRAADLSHCERENTILTALCLMRDRFGDVPYLRIRLEKKIPVGAGLGGGSADAGAVIRAVSEHYSLDWEREEVTALAMEIGSDVPFAVVGGTARVEGKGERVEPLPFPFRDLSYVIVSPDVAVSTGWAYEELDRIDKRPVCSAGRMIEALRRGDYEAFKRSIWNTFESVLFVEHPRLADYVVQLEEAGCEAAWMTGSGSNLVGLCRDFETAEKVVRDTKWSCPLRAVRPVAGHFE